MRISDWSSDVCSSDLDAAEPAHVALDPARAPLDVWAGPGRAIFLGVRQHRRQCRALRRRQPRGILAPVAARGGLRAVDRSEEHTSELQSLMRISYAVFCLKKKNRNIESTTTNTKS